MNIKANKAHKITKNALEKIYVLHRSYTFQILLFHIYFWIYFFTDLSQNSSTILYSICVLSWQLQLSSFTFDWYI